MKSSIGFGHGVGFGHAHCGACPWRAGSREPAHASCAPGGLDGRLAVLDSARGRHLHCPGTARAPPRPRVVAADPSLPIQASNILCLIYWNCDVVYYLIFKNGNPKTLYSVQCCSQVRKRCV